MRLLTSMSAHRAIDPDSQLEPVAIGEGVVLVFWFDCLERRSEGAYMRGSP